MESSTSFPTQPTRIPEEAFSKDNGAKIIEDMRDSWRQTYDFTLIDSRTGITDSGGVCTVQLPDYLVLVFAANDQNLEGAIRVVRGIHASRAEFGYDRQRLMVIPLLSRFDGRAEKAMSDRWLEKCASAMQPFLNEWLPVTTKALDYFDKTKLPHIPKYAFGEQLAVLEERNTDTDALTYYYSAITRLVAGHLQRPEDLLALPRTMTDDDKEAIFHRAVEWQKSQATVTEIEKLIATLPATAHKQAESMREQIRSLAPSDPTLRNDLAALARSTSSPGERDKALGYLKLLEGVTPEAIETSTRMGAAFLWILGTWLGIIPQIGVSRQNESLKACGVSTFQKKPFAFSFGVGSLWLALTIIVHACIRVVIAEGDALNTNVAIIYFIGAAFFTVHQQSAFKSVLRYGWLGIFPIAIFVFLGAWDPLHSIFYAPVLLSALSAIHLCLLSRPKQAPLGNE